MCTEATWAGKLPKGGTLRLFWLVQCAQYCLLELAWQVGAVHIGMNNNRKNREKGGSYFG